MKLRATLISALLLALLLLSWRPAASIAAPVAGIPCDQCEAQMREIWDVTVAATGSPCFDDAAAYAYCSGSCPDCSACKWKLKIYNIMGCDR